MRDNLLVQPDMFFDLRGCQAFYVMRNKKHENML